jgi:hypothetical protein
LSYMAGVTWQHWTLLEMWFLFEAKMPIYTLRVI